MRSIRQGASEAFSLAASQPACLSSGLLIDPRAQLTAGEIRPRGWCTLRTAHGISTRSWLFPTGGMQMRRGKGRGWFAGTALLKRMHEVLALLLSKPRWQFGLQKLSTTQLPEIG
jgi:hypothetical protein